MIPPVRCFTCGEPISKRKWDTYINMIKPENFEDTHTNIEYEVNAMPPLGQKVPIPKEEQTSEYIALNYLHVRKMCCRRMYLGSIDIFAKL